MIDKQKGKYFLICDACGEHVEFDTWDEATSGKRDAGFVSKKYSDGWKDLCAECKE